MKAPDGRSPATAQALLLPCSALSMHQRVGAVSRFGCTPRACVSAPEFRSEECPVLTSHRVPFAGSERHPSAWSQWRTCSSNTNNVLHMAARPGGTTQVSSCTMSAHQSPCTLHALSMSHLLYKQPDHMVTCSSVRAQHPSTDRTRLPTVLTVPDPLSFADGAPVGRSRLGCHAATRDVLGSSCKRAAVLDARNCAVRSRPAAASGAVRCRK